MTGYSGPVGHELAAARAPGGSSAGTSAIRRVVLAVGWTALGSALAVAAQPSRAPMLWMLLAGAALVAGLCVPLRASPWVGVWLAAGYGVVAVGLRAAEAGLAGGLHEPADLLASPVLRQPAALWPELAASALLLVSPLPAAWAARVFTEPAAPGRSAARVPADPAGPLVSRGLAARLRVEAEIARAARESREVSLALLCVDGAEPAEGRSLMDLLDVALVSSLAPSDGLCEYGAAQRLVVLPDVSAPALRTGAVELCAAASESVGRPVRAALATFPTDGSSLRYLLDSLELGLASGRGQGQQAAAVNAPPLAPAGWG